MRRIARFGFGAYRLADASGSRALRQSLDLGLVRLIDTSPNYGDSERLVGTVVREWLADSGEARENITVITKVGVIQSSDLVDAKEREASGRAWPGVVKLSPTAWYCISPEYVEHSVARSAERLGLQPDCVLLHNPEFILAEQQTRGGRAAVDTDGFYHRLAGAFETLEHCHDGSYGVSANRA